ncbi:hypothetical protein PFISCL1PPCAC_2660 [Pristionchus fissidentatus]|uniref:Fungal lipase-type domain-containing protein n=1 Tax=Pristionchus fissidentatus TaxID=1538716 RepID=A0AAV5UYS0_9BILA|nr:hypothetical protein PFISCL1PPCAC_2660 [Pristionchus fissidentatus]
MTRLLLQIAAILLSSVAAFDDALARNVFLPLASAAYGDFQQQCLDKHLPGFQLSYHAEILCDDQASDDTCSGYTAVNKEKKVIALVFRGTVGDDELGVEIYTTLSEEKVAFKDGGMVAPYFNRAFNRVWDDAGLGNDFMLLTKLYPDYSLYITGHSLGGALAAMGAVHVATNKLFPAERITYYTFGEPRTGDKTFADLLDSLIHNGHYRVIHNHDVIPHCPFLSMKYQHHATEVWYENDMAVGDPYTICVGQEDPNCSAKNQFKLNFEPDHPHYFGIDVPVYGKSGCTNND